MKRTVFSMWRILAVVSFAALTPSGFAQTGTPPGYVEKLGQDIDVRSGARILADKISSDKVTLPGLFTPVASVPAVPQIQLRGGNTQANDPLEDYMQVFSGFPPIIHALQGEVSMAAFGRNIVVTFNDLGGAAHLIMVPGVGLEYDQLLIAGFATSKDGGETWTRGFFPPAAGASFTFGDPSVGVDRHGNFYFSNLVLDADNVPAVSVNRSSDGGFTWSAGVVVQSDDGSDKDWLAVGPDPNDKSRDNVYVTWTSFQPHACELRFGRSTDGGETFTAKTIYVPTADPDPTHPQNCLQFTNPVVDQITGSLYVPFLHFAHANQDFIQMLISDDAGETFRFATFNIPGAPDPTVMPVTQPGEITECGGRNFRLTVHGPAHAGPGRFGIPRYINASQMTAQPALAARNGTLYMAWSSSTNPQFGAGTRSNILFMRSDDGGTTWSMPITVNPVLAVDSQHVLPALAIDTDPNDVHVMYYTQHSNGSLDVDMANSHDSGVSFPLERTIRVSSKSFDLPPSNIPLSNAPSYSATNFDIEWEPCWALGEYESVVTANGSVYAGWTDMRNLMTEPINALDAISGQTHSQPDVFFQKVKAQ